MENDPPIIGVALGLGVESDDLFRFFPIGDGVLVHQIPVDLRVGEVAKEKIEIFASYPPQ
jgi:hypothetical protein